jgi:hypothetical protein
LTNGVRKSAVAFTGPQLCELYALLLKNPVTHLARPVGHAKVDDGGNLVVELCLLGLSRKPWDEMQTCNAVRSVLVALQGLHSLGWVHRDVRPANVLFDVVRDEFFLMDLEWAERRGEKMGRFSAAVEVRTARTCAGRVLKKCVVRCGCGHVASWTPIAKLEALKFCFHQAFQRIAKF